LTLPVERRGGYWGFSSRFNCHFLAGKWIFHPALGLIF
jgi:hypothetical protein